MGSFVVEAVVLLDIKARLLHIIVPKRCREGEQVFGQCLLAVQRVQNLSNLSCFLRTYLKTETEYISG